MELLINALLRGGAEKRNLCAKVFGGARMLDEFSDIGKSNADFAQEFLDTESIPCVSKSLQGNQARRIRFWPVTGRVQQYLVKRSEVEVRPNAPAIPVVAGSDLTLF